MYVHRTFSVKVAEEVGDLKVHCCNGCIVKDQTSGDFEVDPQGTYNIIVCVCDVYRAYSKCTYLCIVMYTYVYLLSFLGCPAIIRLSERK